MKKIIMTLVCLMAMVSSVNAQHYYRHYYHPSSLHHTFKRFRIVHNAEYNLQGRHEPFSPSHVEHTILGGTGVGKSHCDGDFSSSIDIDCIVYNVFLSFKIKEKDDVLKYDTHKGEYDLGTPLSVQIGYMFNILSFGGKDIIGRSHCAKVFISPLVGLGYTEFGGALMAKYQFVYALGKLTNKGYGVSVGVCF